MHVRFGKTNNIQEPVDRRDAQHGTRPDLQTGIQRQRQRDGSRAPESPGRQQQARRQSERRLPGHVHELHELAVGRPRAHLREDGRPGRPGEVPETAGGQDE